MGYKMRILCMEHEPTYALELDFILSQISTPMDLTILNNSHNVTMIENINQYDLIMIGINLLPADGYITHERLRAVTNLSHTPVIAMLAEDVWCEEFKQVQRAGFDHCIVHPISARKWQQLEAIIQCNTAFSVIA